MEIGEPKDGEIKVKNKAIGLNFIDIYYRKGVYKASTMPFTPGQGSSLSQILILLPFRRIYFHILAAFLSLINLTDRAPIFQAIMHLNQCFKIVLSIFIATALLSLSRQRMASIITRKDHQ